MTGQLTIASALFAIASAVEPHQLIRNGDGIISGTILLIAVLLEFRDNLK